MTTAADSASKNLSPHSSGFSGDSDGINSPQYRRGNLKSPWSQVVRGEGESTQPRSPPPSSSLSPGMAAPEPIVPASTDNSASEIQPESFNGDSSNVDRPKKSAWNKPSNGFVDVSPVMGAVSWPPLSESTKASPKSQASDSPKPVGPSSQGPVISHSSQKQITSNANPNSNPNHKVPARQRSLKRGGGNGSGPNHGGSHAAPPPPPPPPPPFPIVSLRPNNWQLRPIGGIVPVNEHPMQRNGPRRGSFGPSPRGNGPYHNRHDGWTSPRASNGVDVHMQPQRPPPRAFVGPTPPNPAPFIAPPPVRPFHNQMGYPEMSSPVYYVQPLPPESFTGVPFVTHAPPPPVFFPMPDLPTMIVNQIDYYFSDSNLQTDNYLKQNMNEQGWVPISLIAGFNRVKNLTSNIRLILDSLRASVVVEVQGDKIRRRNEWARWLPTTNRVFKDPGSQSPNWSSSNTLATQFQKVKLGEATTGQNSSSLEADSHTGPSESVNQSQPSNKENSSQGNVEAENSSLC